MRRFDSEQEFVNYISNNGQILEYETYEKVIFEAGEALDLSDYLAVDNTWYNYPIYINVDTLP